MKSTVTYEAVAQAAAQLVSRRESPTIRAVRLMVGGGSFSTIAKHLDAWKKTTQGSDPAQMLMIASNRPFRDRVNQATSGSG